MPGPPPPPSTHSVLLKIPDHFCLPIVVVMDDVHQLSHALERITGAGSLSDPRVASLLERWGAAHAFHGKALGIAALAVRPPIVCEAVDTAVRGYAESLFTPRSVVELLLDLNAPRAGFRTLSKHLHRLNPPPTWSRSPATRPLCTDKDFHAEWDSLLSAMHLDDPVSTDDPPATGVSWPLDEWAEYVQSREALAFDLEQADAPIVIIVRGDGYPIGGEVFSQMCVGLANHGKQARRPAFCWVLGLAACHDNQMATLGELWKTNFEVFRAHASAFGLNK